MAKTHTYDSNVQEWNDSLTGDFIWSNVNVGEAVTGVMTPLTWSIFNHTFSDITFIPGYNMVGNICGRIYNNISLTIALLRLSGRNPRDFGNELGGGYEQFEDWIEQSRLRIPFSNIFQLVPNLFRFNQKQKNALRQVEAFLSGNPKWCKDMKARLENIATNREMADFWEFELAKYGLDGFWIVFSSAMHYTDLVGKLRKDLIRQVGERDANTLLSNVSSDQELLASLGLVVGVWKVHHGDWTPEMFFDQYGHRGPYEDRSISPNSVDGAKWFDDLLESYANSAVDVDALLENQRVAFETTLHRFQNLYPRQAKTISLRLKRAAQAARQREATRSEFMRITYEISQPCVLKAGEMTGLGNDIHFLTYQEIWDLLRHQSNKALPQIPDRKSAYEMQRARPPYPPVIRGQFDPVKWLADPDFCAGYYDSHEVEAKDITEQGPVIKGMPGSVGQVKGFVRLVDSVDHANQLKLGEILVTFQTNVGWTPYFPRLAAVITDVGAPLSHAAIVARELGIPAVVGCRNATSRLKIGDYVRVDGVRGIVEILERAM